MRLALAALIVLASTARAVERVEKVTLQYELGGRSFVGRTRVFVRHGDSFTSEDRIVPARLVRQIADHALAAPAVAPDLDRLGLTKEEVRAYVYDRVYFDAPMPVGWVRDALDRHALDELLRHQPPTVRGEGCGLVHLVLEGERRVVLDLNVDALFRLPWTISSEGHVSTSYDEELAPLVAQLDPRLGPRLAEDTHDAVFLELLRPYLSSVDTDRPLPPSIASRVSSGSAVGPLYGLDPRGERVWTGDVALHANDGVRFRLSLTTMGHGYHDTRRFEHDAPELVRGALRLPNGEHAVIHYQDDTPLTKAAKADVIAAVRANAPENVAYVAAKIDRAFAAAIDHVVYVVLPDDTYFRFYGSCEGCAPIGKLVHLGP